MRHFSSSFSLFATIIFFFIFELFGTSAYGQLTINLGADTALCGSTLTLDAGSFSAGATYTWSTTATTQTIIVTTTGTYYVDVIDGAMSGSDTIVVTVLNPPAAPIVNDTIFCKDEMITVPARGISTGTSQVLWFDSLSPGTDSLIAVGDTLFTLATKKDTFYAEVGTFVPSGRVGPPDNTFSSGAYISGNGFGSTFDALQTLKIDSVFIYADDTLTLEVSIIDANGTTLQHSAQIVEAIPFAKTAVALGFIVGPGSNYKLVVSSISGGRIHRNLSPSYPYTLPGIVTITKASNNSSAAFYSFYDWHISAIPCPSARTRCIVDVVSIPTLSLGKDTVVCGDSVILDAGNPGAIYLWSTGANSQMITLYQSDTVSVTASFSPACPTSDTVIAYINPASAQPVVDDSTFCRGETIVLPAQGGDVFFWYQDHNGQDSLIAITDTLVTPAIDSIVYGVATGFSIPGIRVGPIDNSFGSSIFLNALGLGLQFDVEEFVIIDSVAVYTDGPSTFEISILDSSGLVIHSRTVSTTLTNVKSFVPLGFVIAPGNNYEMHMTSHSGGRLNRVLSPNFPYQLADIITITGNQAGGGNPYYYFFDWHLSEVTCIGPKVMVNAYVVPAPSLELGADTIICGDSLLLDAGNPMANHLWSTGATSQTIYVAATDTISITSSFTSQCESRDTVIVTVLDQPATPLINDQTICSNGLVSLPATGQNTQVLWYDSDTSSNVLFVGDTLHTMVTDTTTYFVEGATPIPTGRVGLLDNTGNSASIAGDRLGLSFDAYENLVIDRVYVFGSVGTEVIVSLLDANDNTLATSSVTQVLVSGMKFPIDLGFVVPKGNGYKLLVHDISLGTLSRNLQVPFPFILPGVLSINSAHNGSTSAYYYLYDWEISTFFCTSPRSSATVYVKLPLDIPSFTYSCGPLTLDATGGNGTYLWNTGATSSTLFVDTTGTYIVTVDDGAGCIVTDTAEVIIPVLDIGKDGVLCGNSILSGYDTSSVFLWSTGDTTPDITIFTPDTISVIVQEPNGCTLHDTLIISGFDTFPIVNIGSDTIVCEQLCINAGNPTYSHLWTTGDTSQTICITSSGTVGVTVTNSNGCSSYDELNVTIRRLPLSNFAFVVNQCEVCFNNLSTLGTFNWNFGDGASSTQVVPCHVYLDTGTYSTRLIVTNSCGMDTMIQSVTITECGTDGIDQELAQAIGVAPNPVTDKLRITFERSINRNISMKLIAMDGRLLLSQELDHISSGQEEEIEMSRLASGVYYLIFEGINGRYFFKVFK